MLTLIWWSIGLAFIGLTIVVRLRRGNMIYALDYTELWVGLAFMVAGLVTDIRFNQEKKKEARK